MNAHMHNMEATPAMVRFRTVELAAQSGRGPLEISQRDYERAKRELTGETDPDRQLAILYRERRSKTYSS
ncbi:MAG: hypothetical protein ACNA8L_13390 [Luteolibacter sp.]